jgi:hypothetical protein
MASVRDSGDIRFRAYAAASKAPNSLQRLDFVWDDRLSFVKLPIFTFKSRFIHGPVILGMIKVMVIYR